MTISQMRLVDGYMLFKAIMSSDVVSISMDSTIGDAIVLCAKKRIRHLPVVDENNRLVGIVTDRDLRQISSPRLGTISENNSDREVLTRHIHVMMVRRVISCSPETPLSEAASLMLKNRIGCLPAVDEERHIVGIATDTDFLRYIAQS